MENILLNVFDQNVEEDFDFSEDIENANRKPWKIENLGGADWCFRKIKEIETERDKQVKYAEEEIKKYQEYIRSIKEKSEHKAEFFKIKLQNYVVENMLENPNFKIKTMVGTAGFKTKTNWDYGDEEKLIEFLENNDLKDFVRTKEVKNLNKVDLKKNVNVTDDGDVVDNNGQIIEGVKVSKEEIFDIKLS